MNKIYKLVWSQVKNTWVAASEMAKSHGKSNRARGRVTLVAAVLGVLMVTALPTFGVYAADLTAEQKAVYDAVLAKLEADKKVVHYFSVNSDNLAGQNDKSFDDFSGYSNKKATGVQSMAIGRMSRTPVTGAMAVGNHAVAEGFFSVAIGPDALVTGEHITSDQYEALSDEDKQLYAPADTAATSYLKIKMKATKDGQKSFEAEVNQGVAVGRHARVQQKRGTAIGSYAETYDLQGTALGFEAHATGDNSTALGATAKARSKNSVAIGFGTEAAFNDSVALGSLSRSQTKAGISGWDTSLGISEGAISSDKTHVWTSTLPAISVGNDQKGLTRQIINVAAGLEDTDAVNVAQLKRLREKHNTDSDELSSRISSNNGDISKLGDKVLNMGDNIKANTVDVTNLKAGWTLKDAKSGAKNVKAKDEVKVSGDKYITPVVSASGLSLTVDEKALNTRIGDQISDYIGDDISQNQTDIKNLQAGFSIKDGNSGSSDVALGGKDKAAITFKAVTQEGDGTGDALTAAVSDDQTVTYTLNTKKLKQDLGIGDQGVGTMNSWKLKAGDGTAKDVADGDTVAFDVKEPNKGLTVEQDGNTVKYGIDGSAIDLAGNASITNLNKQINDSKIHYFSVKSDNSANPAGTNWNNDGATGDKAIAIGQKAGATGTSDIAIGTEAQATGGWGVAIGQAAKAKASTAVAMAYGAEAKGANSLAIGILSEAKTDDSTAYGREAKALGDVALAVGAQTKAEGNHSSVFGYKATTDSSAWNGTAIGRGAYIGKQAADGTTPDTGVSNNYYTPVDDDTVVEAGKETKNSTAVGFGAKSFGYQNTALGAGAEAFDTNTVAVGVMSKAIGHYANAFGKQARAEGENSTAIGHFARALGASSMALGDYAITSTMDGTGKVNQSVALGSHARVAADNSLALGYNSLASIADDVDTEAYLSKEAFKKENGVVSVGNKTYTIGDETIAQNYRRITNVAGGAADNDAVNVAQLKVVNAKADKNATDITNLKNTVNANGKATKVTVDGNENSQDGNLKITKTEKDGQLTYDLSLNDELTIGKDGKDGKIGINGKDGKSADITVGKGEAGVDGKDGETITRIIYTDKDGKEHKVATLDDGLKFKGDNDTVVTRKLNQQLNITGGADAADLSDNNIGVVGTAGDNGGMAVKLSKKLKGLTSAEFKDGDNVTNITAGDISITKKDGKETKTVNIWDLNDAVNNITNGTTDVSSWKLQANGQGERTIKKDSVVNFVNGTSTKVTIDGNDVTVDLNDATKNQINENTTKITNIDGRVTKIENSIDQKIEDAKVTVKGDDKTGVKVENTADPGKPVNYKVSLEEKVNVGHVTIDGKDSKGEITGLTNTTVDAADFATKGRAATEEQLKAAMGKVQAQSRTTVKAGDNITVTPAATGTSEYTVALAKDISVGSVTANEYKVGNNVTINKDGLTIKEGPSVTTKGIDAGGKTITNVADGKADTDAVNVRQLNAIANAGNQNLAILGGKVSELDGRVNRVGAGAAALAALHPLDFDPDDKWDFAAGYGNYSGANAVAIGAYYRPNEDTMFSVGGSFGGGENMVNAGVSVKLGQGNNVSTSRVAMAKDMLDMQQRMAEMEAQMAKLQGFIGALTGADAQAAMFPDVPENHWAYEYVNGLREQGIVEGYPDGTFGGDRSMTRYEIAAVLYRALSKGVSLDARAVKEFAPELARIRVDVVSKDKEGQPVIERVRVNEEKQAK